MTKYTIRRVTVEEVEIIKDGDGEALDYAGRAAEGMGKYVFEQYALRVMERHLEILRRDAPPICGIDDHGKICQAPAAYLHSKLEQRLCETHYKTMVST